MTKKKYEHLTKSEALILAWKKREDYKGYDRSRGSKFNSWRSVINTAKGRSIGFPERWKSFNSFDEDTKEGWEKGKILCRIDTSKPYSKENCVWREKGQENINKLITLKYNGVEKTLVEWCGEFNLNYNGVKQRYLKGKNFTEEQILFGKTNKLKGVIIDVNDIPEEKKRRNKIIKMLSQYRLKDRKRNFDFDIELDWFYKKVTEGECFYCSDTKNLGLDRVDNTKGHTKDNVVVCCYTCNVARGDNFTHEEMIELGKTIKIIKEKRHEN